ncbi:RNA-splicing factor [Microbotryomycetes sp. JL201]|nr:RNA-splicing factor [Microbotryomycetes sp. JL201]
MSDGAVTFIKKRKGPSGLRQKQQADGQQPTPAAVAGEDDAASAVIQQHRRQFGAGTHLVQGTAGAALASKRNRQANNRDGLALSDSDGYDEDEDGGDKAGGGARARVGVHHSAANDGNRRRRRSSSPPAEVSAEQIKLQQQGYSRTTAALAQGKADADKQADDGLYRGEKAQKHQVPKSFGPIKGGPSNVRTITLVDYQPDVCKDYKETGFCGFGDSCKFLHDRGDYLHGWQLDNSFLSNSAAAGSFMAKQNARNGGGETNDGDDSDQEELPFACLICRKPFGKNPVVTLCGHYFDRECAVKRFAKNTKCFACGASTNGVFNKATKLIEKNKERDRLNAEAAEREEQAINEGADDAGIEIEGLQQQPQGPRGHDREPSDDESVQYEDEEEDERPRKKKRPIKVYE